jgi:hypothetical protein
MAQSVPRLRHFCFSNYMKSAGRIRHRCGTSERFHFNIAAGNCFGDKVTGPVGSLMANHLWQGLLVFEQSISAVTAPVRYWLREIAVLALIFFRAVETAAQETKFVNTAHGMDQEVDDTFLRLVDFKWLMAGVGWWVSLSRLQSDSGYFNECLQRALASDSEVLRERSSELLRFLPDAHQSTTRHQMLGALPMQQQIQNVAL